MENKKIRIFLIDNNNNLLFFSELFNNIYKNTIYKFEQSLMIYKKELDNIKSSDIKSSDIKSEKTLIINELKDTILILKDTKFMLYFTELGLETLEKIRYSSVSKHSNECITRAVFDILFKYNIDFEYNICYLCCNKNEFKKLEIDILKDLRWKIINNLSIQTQIQNENSN